MKLLPPVSRARSSFLVFLGFRFAPPQALCCRRASRAYASLVRRTDQVPENRYYSCLNDGSHSFSQRTAACEARQLFDPVRDVAHKKIQPRRTAEQRGHHIVPFLTPLCTLPHSRPHLSTAES